ncbi:MAG: hypothetical protein NC036_01965 [Muribaculaceae bacterium]|nr:hypothetical protein [Muribaculaceae bacterium]
MEQKYRYDAVIVLDRAIEIFGEGAIYGLYINLEDEKVNNANGNQIENYIAYVLCCSQWLKNGGKIEDDDLNWTHQQQHLDVHLSIGLMRFIEVLFNGMIGYKLINIDPVEVEDTLITDPGIIQKYTQQEGGEE